IGVIDEENLNDVIIAFMELIVPKEIQSSKTFSVLRYGNVTIRPILFAPDRPKPRYNQPKYIDGNELLNYSWQCFRPESRRESCATNYKAVSNWGEQFEKLVGFFKDSNREKPKSIDELYRYFNL
ncbi:MAG TPA: hypothetical protein VKO63_10110, partial [Chitinispirillaceae bacterium]|nr:hypothetical protein [Chitinispirillaceae bacterium]